MRSQLGLDLPERRIGLSAHDFAQLMGAKEVILTACGEIRRRAVGAFALPASAGSRCGRRIMAGRDRQGPVLSRPRPRTRQANRVHAGRQACATTAARSAAVIAARSPRSNTGCAIPIRSMPGTFSSWRGSIRSPRASVRPTVARRSMAPSAIMRRALPTHRRPRPYDELIKLGRAQFAPFIDEPEARALWWPRFERIAKWFADWDIARRESITHLFAEIGGTMQIDAGTRTFTLRARADRIEQLRDGRYAILDFKTGIVPTAKQVVGGPVAATDAGSRDPARGWLRSDSGGRVGGRTCLCPTLRRRSGRRGEAARSEGATATICRPMSPPTTRGASSRSWCARSRTRRAPIEPLVLSMWKTRYGAYDDLARVKEWSATGGTGDDA